MAQTEIILPAMGEGITDATIIKWVKQEGDFVEEDETIVEIATDKVDSEIPAPHAGKIVKLFAAEGDIVKVGNTLAILSSDNETFNLDNIIPVKTEIQSNTQQIERLKALDINLSNKAENKTATPHYSMDLFLSPLVKSMIKKENIPFEKVKTIKGSGVKGRITKYDIQNYLKQHVSTSNKESLKETGRETKSEKDYGRDVEVIPMGRLEKLIAGHMVKSKQTSPHVTSFIEADVSNLVSWRQNNKINFEKQFGDKLTYTPLFIESIIKALKEFPMINISVDGDKIIRKKFINIGMAVALPDGNLIVPVIKKACQQNLIGLVKSVNDLSQKARNNKLKPDDITGGTFSVTNLGTFNNLTGTPIINQPESAILGIGAIIKRPVVIDSATGEVIAIRSISVLSLSFDHRAINGAQAGMFLNKIKENLENFEIHRKF